MSRDLEIRLHGDFVKLAKMYIRDFPHAASVWAKGPADFLEDLEIYDALIQERVIEIHRAAARDITLYSDLFRVYPQDGYDIFKLVYFYGVAVHRQLTHFGHDKIAEIHLFSMIGALDGALRHKKIAKKRLTQALTHLVRKDKLFDQLGPVGCYLTYKCCSTVKRDMIP